MLQTRLDTPVADKHSRRGTMFVTKSAAVFILSTLALGSAAAPAFANHGGFCERIETKLSAQAPSGNSVESLEHELRRSISRAAEDGCDPYGGMMGNAHCAAHVVQIRAQVSEIQRAELRGPDNADALREMYDGANCGQRQAPHVVHVGDEVDLVRGRVLQIAPEEAVSTSEPDAARFASLGDPDIETAPAPDATLQTSSIQPIPVAPVPLAEAVSIPADRRNVRVIGSRFLPDAESNRAFETIATSELDLPNSVFNRVVAWLGLDNAYGSAKNEIADTPPILAVAAD